MMLGETQRPAIDDSFALLVESLPSDLRAETVQLPHRLGLTRHPDGGWEDFVVMDPNRDLPRYAAEAPLVPGTMRIRPDELLAYRRAHHYAAIYGLLDDRLTDEQVPQTKSLLRLRRESLRAWIQALTEATGSSRRAAQVIVTALQSTAKGNHREQAALELARSAEPTKLSPVEYVSFIGEKLRWFGASSHALLLSLHEPERAHGLRRAYDVFSVALQCIDDALDDDRDRAGRGISFPDALGLPPGGLLAAAPGLVRLASSYAEEFRFHELGAWLARVAKTFEEWPIPGNGLQNAFAAAIVHAATKEVYGAH